MRPALLRPLSVLVFAVLLLSGCLGLGGQRTEPHTITAQDEAVSNAHLASYLRNVTVRDPAADILRSILQQYRVRVQEDITIDVWVARPATDKPVPLVLEATPYYGGGSPITACAGLYTALGLGARSCFYPWGEILYQHGYAVAIMSVRGTGNSEGCFTQGGPQEARDTAAVIEHLASQPWSNGNVGMIGVSYPGTTPQDVWVEAPPALKTIVPISGISDMYKYNFVNGIPLNIQGFGFNSYYWAIVGLGPAGLEGGAQILDPTNAPKAIAGEACTDQADVQQGGVTSTADGNKDAYWQVRDFHAELRDNWDQQRASVFYIHGLQDWNVQPHMMEDWLPAIQETGVPFKAFLGQWGHNWPQAATGVCRDKANCRGDWWNTTMIAWFDQFLKGIDTGILEAPAVQVQADDKIWRHQTAFPPKETVWLTLHPKTDGTLGQEPGTGNVRFHDYAGFGPGMVPLDNGPDRATFVTEPLTEDLRITGFPHFVGNTTASGKRASLILTLFERKGAVDRPLDFAGLSLNHAKSLARGEDDVTGRRQPVDLDFYPQDVVVKKGSRLVLVASGYDIVGRARLQPLSDGSQLTLHLDGAALSLPTQPASVVEWPQPYWS